MELQIKGDLAENIKIKSPICFDYGVVFSYGENDELKISIVIENKIDKTISITNDDILILQKMKNNPNAEFN